ncbi:MAG: helix-turn-helix transcriptional regulator [Lachnoanaerobaculum sp.]|jgi:HTH-type transcriptional activator hxlR|nr:helix-turn-helix domain-containing protein [Lachnoanaerobaculum sp.]MBS5880906.1 helix-turn-helix transcriptional regulator [Lachnoanaerobaculum sp.]
MSEKKSKFHCPVEATLSQIGGKYKMIILCHLIHDGTLRYNEIQKHIPQATAKMLVQQLKELESDGLINRKVYPVVPPKTEYSITERGKSLTEVIDSIRDWGRNYMSGTFEE